MKKRVFMRLIATMLAMVIFCSMSVYAAEMYYTPGPIEYELDRSRVISKENVTLEGNNLVFKAGGSICFDHLMPFESETLKLTYESVDEAVNLVIKAGENTYSCTIAPETTSCDVLVKEVYGSKNISFNADKAITIKSVLFHKIKEMPQSYFKLLPDMTDYEAALLTSVAIGTNSTAMKVRLANHRLDIENLDAVPQNIEGSLYVPLESFAVALKLYCEDYIDKSYILLRDDKVELALIGGKGHVIDEKGNKEAIEINVFYRDDTTWVPIRKIAEIFGYHVEYRDGVVVIDERIVAKNIVESDTLFNELKKELSSYAPSKTVGKTYHVAQNSKASDANSGTESYPFATLAKASEVAEAGDTVIIHEGTYRETLRPKNSGTKSNPITFKAADGEKVTISALEPVTKFAPYKDNIVCASIPKDLGMGKNQLFYKGEALEEGRYPNEDDYSREGIYEWPDDIPQLYLATKGDIYVKEEGSNIATSDTLLDQEEEDYWKGGTFVTLKGFGWSLSSADIVGSSKGQIEIADHDGQRSYGVGLTIGTTFAEQGLMWGKYYEDVKPNDFGFITNHINTIDIPGEWHMEDGITYLYPPVGADLTKDFEIKQRQLVIDLRDRSYVVLKDINTIGGGLTMFGEAVETEGNILNGGTHRFISHYTKQIDGMEGFMYPHIPRTEPNAMEFGEVGFFMSGENHTIANATIDYSAAAGIYATGRNHLILNNVVSNTSYTGTYVSGIMLKRAQRETKAGGHTVVKNTSRNAGRAVLQFGGGGDSYGDSINPVFPSEIAYNRFYNGSLITRDTGITYEYGGYQGTDSIRTTMHHCIVYNVIHSDPESQHMVFGIYHDGRIAGRETYNNIVFYEHEYAPIKTGIFVNRPHTEAREYFNSDLTYFPEGIEGLEKGDYPGGRPFYAGSDHDGRERFMDNYNEIAKGNDLLNYPSSSQKTEDGSKYTFDNVFIKGDTYNRVTLFYDRPIDAKTDVFNIKYNVKKGDFSYEQESMVLKNNARFYVDTLGEAYVMLPPMEEGYYSFDLEVMDKEADFYSLTVAGTSEDYKDCADNRIIYGGSWDEADMDKDDMALDRSYTYDLANFKTGTWNHAWNTWKHTAIYKDRAVREDSNMVEIRYGTGYEYSGQNIKIYTNEADYKAKRNPVADFIIEGPSWEVDTIQVPLTRTLKEGNYTFYVDFNNHGKCSNFYYFKFYNDDTQGGASQ